MAAANMLTEPTRASGRVIAGGRPSALETSAPQKAPREDFLASSSLGTTDISSIGDARLITSVSPVLNPGPPRLPLEDGAKSVSAVVAAVTRETVVLDCLLASGHFEIKLPLSLIPETLRAFGQPVTVSLGRDGGYRAPLVEARTIEPVPSDPEVDELKDWLSGL